MLHHSALPCVSFYSFYLLLLVLLSLSLLSPPTSICYVRWSLLLSINNQLHLNLECKLITWSGFPSPESWALELIFLKSERETICSTHRQYASHSAHCLTLGCSIHCSSQSVLGSTVLPCVTPNINSPACHTPTTPSTSTITIQHGEDQVSHLNICVLWVLWYVEKGGVKEWSRGIYRVFFVTPVCKIYTYPKYIPNICHTLSKN